MSGDILTVEQRLTMLESRVNRIESALPQGNTGVLPTPRLVFSWPVGDIARRTLAPWWIGQGYAQKYPPSMGRNDWHTGVDLNLAIPLDVNAEVFACADGSVKFSGVVAGWQAGVVIVEHTLEDGRLIWSRYAHINALSPLIGATVKRGELIGHIADYLPVGPSNDHLHFDLAWCDLGKKPGDWPNLDIVRLKVDYVDPVAFIMGRLP